MKSVVDKVAMIQFALPILIPLTAPHPLIILSLMAHSLDTDSIIK
jgi:hypothetical protein